MRTDQDRSGLYFFDFESIGVVLDNTGITGTSAENLFFPLKLYDQAYYFSIIILFLLSLMYFFVLRNTRPYALPKHGIFIVIYFTVIYCIFFGTERFHFPIIPWMMMYVGYTIEILIQKIKENIKSET